MGLSAAPEKALRLTATILASVAMITSIAPLATDMYVPAFPAVGAELSTSPSMVQLTLTTFFVGMALGQLVGGPVSDSRGRKTQLVIALTVFTLTSVVCALTGSIWVMMAARAVQGLSGGWSMVIARSIVVDLAAGHDLVRGLNLVSGVASVAPVVGPLAGGLILQFSEWRVSFWLLATIGALMVLTVVGLVPESLTPDNRHPGGLAQIGRALGRVLRNRPFVGYLVAFAASMGATFAYVATSAYLLQEMHGLTPVLYSVDFALNALGLALTTLLSARLAGRVATRTLIIVGVGLTALAGGALLIATLWFGTPLWLVLVAFFVLMSAQGLVGPNAGAMASEQEPDHPGTGSAVLGFLQWVAAGLVAPVAALGGAHTAWPMALIIVAMAGAAGAGLLLTPRPSASRAHVGARV